MKVSKMGSAILWGMLLGIAILVAIGICFADGTKEWKFLEYGTYIVPEDFPDKFLDFSSRLLAEDDIAGGKAVMRAIEHRSGALSLLVICYLTTETGQVLVIKTASATGKDPTKQIICIYIDKQLFETGKPSFILTKTDETPDFGKFKKEREFELNRVRI
jgi:hypothetical protein